MLNALLAQAAAIDWSRQALRRTPGPLPPAGFPNGSLPVVERLRFKDLEEGIRPILELIEQTTDLDEMDDDFWSAFDALNQRALVEQTRRLLADEGRAMTIAEIARRLAPSHDLEALALWLTIALEAELPIADEEELELCDRQGKWTRFTLPRVALDAESVVGIELDL